MNKIQSVIAYLCLHYPHKAELTKARLTKMVYLADWFSSLLHEKQISNIKWIFNHYGPYVDDVVDSAHASLGFKLDHQINSYGSSKYVISYDGDRGDIEITDNEKSILDAVIEKTKTLYFNDFIEYVYSTYPVRTEERYSTFDLVSLARKYKSNVKK